MSLAGSKVLILDDDPDFRKIVRKIFEKLGMVVVEAENVKQGLEVAEVHLPQLILTDLQMIPDSGHVFLEKCRNNINLRNIPVLAVSALNDEKSIFQAITLGAVDYIIKPIKGPFLIQRVRKALRTNDFAKYVFPEGERPLIQVSLPMKILAVGEAGLKVEAPVQIQGVVDVNLTSNLLQEMQMDRLAFQSTSVPPKFTSAGHYINDIRTLGVTETIASHIKKIVRTWV